MARRILEVKLDTPTARRRLPPRHEPYWNGIEPGLHIGYRRSATQLAGVWYARFTARKGEGLLPQKKLQHRLGVADDDVEPKSLSSIGYVEARQRASRWLPTAMEISSGEKPRRGGYTVSQALDDYLTEHIAKRKPRSLDVTRYMIEGNIKPKLGNVEVGKLKKRQVEEWLSGLAEHPRRKPRSGEEPDSPEAKRRRKDTANRNLTVLKAALSYAESEDRIACDASAWRPVKPYKGVAKARKRFLKDLEVRRLIEHCTSTAFRLLVMAALFTGCRYGELTRLTVRDFDAENGTIFIPESKVDKAFRIFLDPEGVRFFSGLCRGKRPDELLLNTDEARGWKKDSAKGMMQVVCAAAGIEFLTFAELRHTAASRWIRNGLQLFEVAAQLGHTDTRMVSQHYGHLCKETLAGRVRRISPLRILGPKVENIA